MTFNGHPVVPLPVNCDGSPSDFLKSAMAITNFIAAPLRDIRQGKHKDSLQLLKFAVLHMGRRKNEITFPKCQFQGEMAPREHCQANPVKVEQFLSVLRSAGGFMYEPTPAPNLEGHYMTFFEMLNSIDRSNFSKSNEASPSKPIGKRLMCPAWQFSLITESKQHVSILHPNYRKDSIPTTEKVTTCNRVILPYHQLTKHKTGSNHFVRKQKSDKKETSQQQNNRKRTVTKQKVQSFFHDSKTEATSQSSTQQVEQNQQNNQSQQEERSKAKTFLLQPQLRQVRKILNNRWKRKKKISWWRQKGKIFRKANTSR